MSKFDALSDEAVLMLERALNNVIRDCRSDLDNWDKLSRSGVQSAATREYFHDRYRDRLADLGALAAFGDELRTDYAARVARKREVERRAA